MSAALPDMKRLLAALEDKLPWSKGCCPAAPALRLHDRSVFSGIHDVVSVLNPIPSCTPGNGKGWLKRNGFGADQLNVPSQQCAE